MKEIIFKIYGLTDPFTEQIRYVGLTRKDSLTHRYNAHINEKLNTKKNQWIRSLKSKNAKPGIFLIEECSSLKECNELEIFWIGYFKLIGCRLTNVTIGGDGVTGIKLSAERKEQIRIQNTGSKRSEETKKLLSIKAKERGEEYYKAVTERHRNRSEETKRKNHIARSKWYYSLSKEDQQKIYAKRLETLKRNGYKMSAETIRKQVEKRIGRKVSEETRNKIRQTMVGKKYSKERVAASEAGRKRSRKVKEKLSRHGQLFIKF